MTVVTGIDLCLVDLTEEPTSLALQSLSLDEMEKASRFAFERDRKRYLAAHGALREILSAHTGLPASQLRFYSGEFGKPYLVGIPHCNFNLAHSGDRAIVGLSNHDEIGVDLEMLRTISGLDETARRVFTPSEIIELEHTRTADKTLAFLRGWTRKEACLKAIGSGLSIEPHTFEAGLDCSSRAVRINTGKKIASVEVHSSLIDGDCVVSAAKIRP